MANKYNAKKAVRKMPNGAEHVFDSQKEAARYDQLVLLLRAGKIRNLKIQPQFTLQESYISSDGDRVMAIRYTADFSYERAAAPDCNGTVWWLKTVEDVKSRASKTEAYEIRRRLLQERFGITLVEV